MDYRAELEHGQSKILTLKIVNEVANSQIKMDELMQCFVDGPIRITQRAAWPMSEIAQKHPKILLKYYPLLIRLLKKANKPNVITRNILRAFQFVETPKEHQGVVLDLSFKLLNSSSEPIAVKVFSITIISKYMTKI